MGLRVTVRYPRINIKKSKEKTKQALIKRVIKAAKLWVITTTDLVPVWSGASKASFLKLAFECDVSLAITPVAPIGSRIPLGIGSSEGYIFIEDDVIFGFHWESGLDYIHIVDQHNGFLSAGAAALRRTDNKIALPQPVIEGD